MREVKEGFESEFESLMAKKEALESEKAEAIAKAVSEVEDRFKVRAETIENLLILISVEISPEEVAVEEKAQEKVEEKSVGCESAGI